jgi:hypothetical protein
VASHVIELLASAHSESSAQQQLRKQFSLCANQLVPVPP